MTRRVLVVALAALAAAATLPAAAGAAWTGTNGKLAISSPRSGFPADSDLYTMNADGTTQTRITSLDQDEVNPNWSPDGTKLVFERTAGMRADVYSSNADGSNSVQLTTSTRSDIRPAWSANGTQIVFASDRDSTEGMFDIFVMNANGTGQLNITNTPAINEDYPAWSPNGSLIAFSRDGDIYTMTPAGGSLARLTTAVTDEIEPDWSSSGGQIVYRAGISTDDEIWKMNANGTSQVNLTNNGSLVDEAPVWSPAGDKIAFVRDAFRNAEIYTMNADGTSPTRITNNAVMDAAPAWQATAAQPGTITVLLDAQPNSAQDFAFTAGGGLSPTSFSLDDDADATLSNQRAFANVAPGAGYSVAQTAPSGWDLASATCSDGSPATNINVGSGESITCTFTAKQRGQVVVVEDAQPNDAQDFSFTAGGGLSPTSFSLDDDADATLSSSRTFSSVVARNGYTLAQATVTGWSAGATCSDGSPISNIDVGPAETVTCTFTNQKHGQIVVVEDAQPNDAQDFAFTAGGGLSPTSFSLDDDSDATLSNTRTFASVPSGSGYSLGQTAPTGWDRSSATCSDASPVTNINVSPAEVVTCTFTHVKRASLTVVKDATPNDAQDFGFTAGGGLSPTSFSLDDDSDATLSNTRTFANIVPGSGFSLAESVPSGWVQASAICSDGSPVSNISLSAGESVTCTFSNSKRGQIVVVEDAQPNDAQDFAFTAGGGLSPTSFSLDDDSDATLSNTRTFASVPAVGGYSLAQSAPSGWALSTATCNDGSPITNINVAAAEVVTCTFTHLKRGSITVVKDATPNDPQDFSFTAGGGLSPASFQLDDDSDATLSNTRTFSNVVPGSGFSLAETVPAGWDQVSATCSDASPVTNINLSPGENVTCTFTNRKRGQIVVVADAQPNDPQDFAFTAGGGLSPTSFSLDDDSDAALSNTRTFASVPVGSGYSVAQSVPAGWDISSATCNDGSPITNINVASAEIVTCTFTNRKRGSITVVKDATPDDAQDFSFTAGGGLSPATFQLDNDADATLSNTRTFTNLVPGSGFSVSETVPSGWHQASATCDDGSPVSNVALSAGENVTCTFTNQRRGSIVVVKNATPDDPQDFSFTAGGGLSPASFSLDDDADATLSNTRSFTNLVPAGGYSLSETVPSGWDQTGATCDDGSPVSNVNVAPAETVTCTFANRKRGKVVVVEDAVPNDAQDFSFTAGGGLSPTSFALDDDSDATLANSRTLADVVPGSGYSLSASTPAGWTSASATCDDGSPATNIAIAAGETVTCTFTHQKRGSITVVTQAQPSDAQDFSFTAGGGLSPASFQLDDDADATLSNTRTFSSLSPQSGYSVSESAPPGWDLTSATCNDGSPATNVSVSAGENVTCTFTNRKRGKIVVVKDAQPDSPQNFGFTAGGGLSPTSFTLDDDADATLPNTQTFNDVTPGSGYSLSEGGTIGWNELSATCSDGSPVSNVNVSAGETVTCTFVNQPGYARPRGAGPLKVALVPAFNQCASPNRTHGPALVHPSCNPPVQSSPSVTVGSPDSNGQPVNMSGSVSFMVVLGDPTTPADEADVSIQASITDVRVRSNLSDYAGQLQGAVVLRVTDRRNGAALNEAGTGSDVPFNFTIPCTTTSGPTVGSTCAVVTSADAVLPGVVTETKRSIWQMGDVRVSDGGPDGQASTQDNAPFLRQGVFIP